MTTLGSQDAVLLTTSTNPVVSTGTGQQILFLQTTVANTDNSAHSVTAYRVPQGASPGTSNICVEPFWVNGNKTVAIPGLKGLSLANGASLYMICSTTNVMNVSISYAQP